MVYWFADVYECLLLFGLGKMVDFYFAFMLFGVKYSKTLLPIFKELLAATYFRELKPTLSSFIGGCTIKTFMCIKSFIAYEIFF